jgi:sec-independent protein translocase protein TatC
MARFTLRPARRANPEGRMSVLDHLRELRRRLIIIFLIIATGAVLGWVFYNTIIEILKHPYCRIDYHHRLGAQNQSKSQCNLQFRAPLDGFILRLKVSFIAGAVLTAPLWLHQIWAFVTPGLRRNERRWTIAFVLSSTLLFVAGMALAYVTLAKSLDVLIVSAGSGVQASLDVTQYISFVILMLVIFGASFELPLLIVMLNLVRVLPYKVLKRGQRLGIFLIFVFAAMATPSTDPFTMIGMALPMCILFELAVLWTFLHDRRRDRRAAAEQANELPDDVPSAVDPLPEQLPADSADRTESNWSDLP